MELLNKWEISNEEIPIESFLLKWNLLIKKKKRRILKGTIILMYYHHPILKIKKNKKSERETAQLDIACHFFLWDSILVYQNQR